MLVILCYYVKTKDAIRISCGIKFGSDEDTFRVVGPVPKNSGFGAKILVPGVPEDLRQQAGAQQPQEVQTPTGRGETYTEETVVRPRGPIWK